MRTRRKQQGVTSGERENASRLTVYSAQFQPTADALHPLPRRQQHAQPRGVQEVELGCVDVDPSTARFDQLKQLRFC